jgi:hypothetical protein
MRLRFLTIRDIPDVNSIAELTSSGNSMLGRLQLAELFRAAAVDYLNRGRALDLWSEFLSREQSPSAIVDIVRYLRCHESGGLELDRLIGACRRSHERSTFQELKQAFEESLKWRERFRLIGCRGLFRTRSTKRLCFLWQERPERQSLLQGVCG